MQISGIKTKEDALAAVDTYQLPSVDAKASDETKANNKRQSGLISAGKEFVKARILAVPSDVKIVGIEVRAEVGPIEVFSVRIIQHR